MDETRLIELLREGDPLSFEILFQQYYVRFYNFVLNLTKSPHTAEDIVQNVFYDDGERSIIYVVFPDHIENGKLYHKGEKVLDRTAEFEHLENGEDVFE